MIQILTSCTVQCFRFSAKAQTVLLNVNFLFGANLCLSPIITSCISSAHPTHLCLTQCFQSIMSCPLEQQILFPLQHIIYGIHLHAMHLDYVSTIVSRLCACVCWCNRMHKCAVRRSKKSLLEQQGCDIDASCCLLTVLSVDVR